MKLDSLVLHNIRSHTHTELMFESNTTLFSGDMGGGKSSILMGIEFALFGLGSLKSSQVLRRHSNSGYVVLDFTVNGVKYSIRRTLKQSQSSDSITTDAKQSWLREDGVDHNLSPTEMKQRILQILNYKESLTATQESRIFRYAVFTPQESMKDVLNDRGDRLNTIRKAFHIEEYSTALDNAKRFVVFVRSEVKTLKALCEELPELGNVKKTALENKISYNKIVDENNSIINFEEKTISEIRDQLSKLEISQVAFNETNRKIESVRGDKTRAESDLASSLNRKTELENKILEKQTELAKYPENNSTDNILDIEHQLDQIAKQKAEYETSMNELSRHDEKYANMNKMMANNLIQREKDEQEAYDKLINEYNRQNEQNLRELARITALIDASTHDIEKLENLGDECNTCGQTINHEHKHRIISTKQSKINSLKQEKPASLVKPVERNPDKTRLELAASYLQNLPRLEELKGITAYKPQNPDELKTRRETAINHEHNNTMKKRIDDEIRDHELEVSRIDIIMLEKTVNNIIKNLDGLILLSKTQTDNTADINEKTRSLDAHSKTLHEASIMIASTGAKLEAVDGEIAKLDEKISSLSDKKTRMAKFREIETWINDQFKEKITQIEKKVLLSIHAEFNELFVKWMTELMDDPTKTASIDNTFTPIISQDGVDQQIGFLSGGEKTSVALAYRLALNELVRRNEQVDSSLLILDEPTDGFSKEQLHKMTSILAKLEARQIILVSHDRELENCADQKYVITKQDGESMIKQI